VLRLILFQRFTFEKKIKKFREKSTNNNASPMDLVVGAGTCWIVPLAGFRGSNRLLALFFLPRRFGITFFEKVLMQKNCERKRHPNGGIGCKRHENFCEIEVSMRKRKTGRVEPSYHLFSWAPDIALATS
jgi:hypothetical protein